VSLYYEDGGLALYHGSNKDILPTFDAESFDSIVTDPPYELGFMGKGWDSSGIAYDVEMWRECWRVLKPGGYLLAFGGTRTWHRIATAIEDAGFEIRDSIAWLYGSGFPKSMDVSKAIDKAAGATREVVSEGASGAGTSTVSALGDGLNVNFAPRPVTAPATDAAREWEGWGTALKPAFEPVVVARKPLGEKTVAANVLAHGTGAINIDATRIESGAEDQAAREEWSRRYADRAYAESGIYGDGMGAKLGNAHAAGRWPANVALDESQAAALDAQSGTLTSGANPKRRGADKGRTVLGEFAGQDDANPQRGVDIGGASRFFYVAPIDELEERFIYGAKAPKSERPEVDGVAHATVKPLDLMRWLVRLVTRRGGRVLDPFAGSGTTGEAALLEGMEAVLIELEETHLPLILQRVRKPLQPSMFGDWEETA